MKRWSLLDLAQVEKGDITLTTLGTHYAAADHALRKRIFGQQLLTHVPLAIRIIRKGLEQRGSRRYISQKKYSSICWKSH